MQLKVLANKSGEFFDRDFTCDGKDVSPKMDWSEVPKNAKSLALVMDDPDAPLGTFVHWVIYNISPDLNGLQEDVPKTDHQTGTYTQGANGFRRTGYGGPCPPRGNPHRYYFRLYATSLEPDLKPGLKKKELMKLIEHDILEQSVAMFKYGRT